MATHGTQPSTRTARLPDAVPLDLPVVSRLSWELGSRVVSDAPLLGEWEHPQTGRRLDVYDATDQTVVLAVRTPVGRRRFFGATKDEFEARRSRLADADDWRRS
jgi:hypothetical protein